MIKDATRAETIIWPDLRHFEESSAWQRSIRYKRCDTGSRCVGSKWSYKKQSHGQDAVF